MDIKELPNVINSLLILIFLQTLRQAFFWGAGSGRVIARTTLVIGLNFFFSYRKSSERDTPPPQKKHCLQRSFPSWCSFFWGRGGAEGVQTRYPGNFLNEDHGSSHREPCRLSAVCSGEKKVKNCSKINLGSSARIICFRAHQFFEIIVDRLPNFCPRIFSDGFSFFVKMRECYSKIKFTSFPHPPLKWRENVRVFVTRKCSFSITHLRTFQISNPFSGSHVT